MTFELVKDEKMKFKEVLVAGLIVMALLGIMVGVIVSDHAEREVQKKCAVSCGVLKDRLIDGACHCMTDKGWEVKK